MKLVALVVALMLCVGIAYAEQTSGPTYSGRAEGIVDFLNEVNDRNIVTHDHEYTDKDTPKECDANIEYGAGVDLVVYQADPAREGAKKMIPDEVTVQNKYDFGNQNFSSYVVAKYNIWELLKKKTE